MEAEGVGDAVEMLEDPAQTESVEIENTDPPKRKKQSRLSARKKQKVSAISDADKNAIMLLHEKFPNVVYETNSQGGPIHQPMFTVEAKVNDQSFIGTGTSKKKARLAAAETAVEALNLRPPPGLSLESTDNINFAADDLSLMQQSSGTGFIVNRISVPAVAQAAAVPKAEKVPEPIGKSPLLILNELRPGQQYGWRTADGTLEKDEKKEERNQKYTCVLTLDDQLFEEVGGNRKVAKAKVAATALKQLYGIDFVYTSDGVPVFQGEDSAWIAYKAREEDIVYPAVCNGKNPIQMLNELYPGVAYTELSECDNVKSFGHKFVFSLVLEGETYQAEGNTKKVAKTRCALNAVLGLEESGFLARRLAEKAAKVTNKKKPHSGGPAWNHKGKPGSSIIKLAVHFPNLEYTLVSQTDPWNNGQFVYTVAVTVRGENFTGVHSSEIGAKDQAAGKVLAHFGLASSEDSKIESGDGMSLSQDLLASKGLD